MSDDGYRTIPGTDTRIRPSKFYDWMGRALPHRPKAEPKPAKRKRPNSRRKRRDRYRLSDIRTMPDALQAQRMNEPRPTLCHGGANWYFARGRRR